MPANANQHYVPKFYFKFFNGGTQHICLLLTKTGRIVSAAPIDGQSPATCSTAQLKLRDSSHNSKDCMRGCFAPLSTRQRRTTDPSGRTNTSRGLWQAIVFQRARTMLEVEKESPAISSLLLHMFTQYIMRTMPPEKVPGFLGPIERGEARITESPTSTVLRQKVRSQNRVMRQYS